MSISRLAWIFIGLTLAASPAAKAQTILDEWANVKAPAPPAAKPAPVDAKTTALLMLDFMEQNCGKRPRCVASEPKVKKLLDSARQAGAAVVYSIIANTTTGDVLKSLAPKPEEIWVQSGADKFFGTNLEKILREKNIGTVIVVGTAAHGAVLNTASGAAFRGLNVVVPVDGVSSSDLFSEQYTAWHLANAPTISPKITITTTDQIKF
jgi:nicotinamidase-related amidase